MEGPVGGREMWNEFIYIVKWRQSSLCQPALKAAMKMYQHGLLTHSSPSECKFSSFCSGGSLCCSLRASSWCPCSSGQGAKLHGQANAHPRNTSAGKVLHGARTEKLPRGAGLSKYRQKIILWAHSKEVKVPGPWFGFCFIYPLTKAEADKCTYWIPRAGLYFSYGSSSPTWCSLDCLNYEIGTRKMGSEKKSYCSC